MIKSRLLLDFEIIPTIRDSILQLIIINYYFNIINIFEQYTQNKISPTQETS